MCYKVCVGARVTYVESSGCARGLGACRVCAGSRYAVTCERSVDRGSGYAGLQCVRWLRVLQAHSAPAGAGTPVGVWASVVSGGRVATRSGGLSTGELCMGGP